jgi:hypothetical protein
MILDRITVPPEPEPRLALRRGEARFLRLGAPMVSESEYSAQ